MTELELNGHHYRTGTLNAYQQQEIVLKLLPIIGGLMTALGTFEQDKAAGMALFAEQVAQMNPRDVERIEQLCLAVCQRRDNEMQPWQQVQPPQGVLAFQDIDLLTILKLTGATLQDQLTPFLSALGVGRISAAQG